MAFQKTHNRIVFFGTPEFATSSLEWLLREGYTIPMVVTQPDRPTGRKQRLAPPPIKELALQHGLNVSQPERFDATWLKEFADAKPDVALLVAYGKILPTELLQIPRLGFLNIHASLLPELRGPAPIQYAICKGHATTGVSLQDVVERVDEGDVYGSIRVKIEPEDDSKSLEHKLREQTPQLLANHLPSILNGTATATPQNHTKATYSKMIHKPDGRIRWQYTAQKVHCIVRALSANPGTFSTLGDRRIKIRKVRVAKEIDNVPPLNPGEVHFDQKRLLVGCGSGIIEVDSIQPEGKQPMSGLDFIRGYQQLDGAILS